MSQTTTILSPEFDSKAVRLYGELLRHLWDLEMDMKLVLRKNLEAQPLATMRIALAKSAEEIYALDEQIAELEEKYS